MAETHEGYITLANGEAAAMAPWRRVKFKGSDTTACEYADASDGDSWIGATVPMEGGNAAVGAPQTIRLRCEGYSLKVECSAAVAANGAACYPENDGKVSDDAGTVIIGTSLSTATTGIIEMLPNAGSGSAPGAGSVASGDLTAGAVVIGLVKTGLAALATTHEVPKPARKLKLIKAWGTLRDGTTDTGVLLKVGATAICAAIVFTGTDETVEFQLTDAVTEVAAASTIYASIATAATAPGMDIYVLAVPIT